ncbi:MAG: hypothetical protein J0H02_02110 [Armatimonadetes bacterium]|nr:hypothetical protein [Armatimonadota bacterium]
MNTTTKSLFAGGAVLCAAASILLGISMRDRVDVGGISADPAPLSGLVASTDSREVPEGDYFYEISQLLKQRYVEPITDEQKLALGAIRGMVASLGDPDSLYMDKDEYRVYKNAKAGKYEGIGVYVELEYSDEPSVQAKGSAHPVDTDEALLGGMRIPKLTVVTVVPGSPADRAGVQVGDWVEYIDDHWVPNAATVISFRKLEKAVQQGKAKLEDLVKERVELRQRTKKTLLPLKAKDKLVMGTSGTLKIVWRRGDVARTTEIKKEASAFSTPNPEDPALRLAFNSEAPNLLKKAIQGKSSIVIDLKNNAVGDFGSMKQCLEALAPSGVYGSLKTAKTSIPFKTESGNANPPKVVLLVDESTRGLAEIFALALSSSKIAKLSGSEMSGHRIVVEDNSLPDGSGYTLATAEYKVTAK